MALRLPLRNNTNMTSNGRRGGIASNAPSGGRNTTLICKKSQAPTGGNFNTSINNLPVRSGPARAFVAPPILQMRRNWLWRTPMSPTTIQNPSVLSPTWTGEIPENNPNVPVAQRFKSGRIYPWQYQGGRNPNLYYKPYVPLGTSNTLTEVRAGEGNKPVRFNRTNWTTRSRSPIVHWSWRPYQETNIKLKNSNSNALAIGNTTVMSPGTTIPNPPNNPNVSVREVMRRDQIWPSQYRGNGVISYLPWKEVGSQTTYSVPATYVRPDRFRAGTGPKIPTLTFIRPKSFQCPRGFNVQRKTK